jgi:hypothetical protein
MLTARSLAAGTSRFTGSLISVAPGGIQHDGPAAKQQRTIGRRNDARFLVAHRDMRRPDRQRRAAEGVRKLDAHAPSADAGVRDHAQRLVVEAGDRGRLRRGGAGGAGCCRLQPGAPGDAAAGNARGCCGEVAQVDTQCSVDCAKTHCAKRAAISSFMSNTLSRNRQKAAGLVDLFLADDVRPALCRSAVARPRPGLETAEPLRGGFLGTQSSTSLPVSRIRKPASDCGAVAFQSDPGTPINPPVNTMSEATRPGWRKRIFERQAGALRETDDHQTLRPSRPFSPASSTASWHRSTASLR